MKQSIALIEKNYMQRERDQTYFANEDLRHDWSLREVEEIENLWKEGKHITKIAKLFDCDPDEVFLLIFDRARHTKGKEKVMLNFGQLFMK
ncbi:hypothetical protein [Alkalihalobacterium alkalinitrilicum]|uniref:hypothetical protein n=1 Tax=Alkalihalobacterium alkalinitrilicum TaxID=427920 RepID=UPI000995D54C|nr:hypothetical protein [Alkalihalobacterium alkalinitrilicum]